MRHGRLVPVALSPPTSVPRSFPIVLLGTGAAQTFFCPHSFVRNETGGRMAGAGPFWLRRKVPRKKPPREKPGRTGVRMGLSEPPA